MSTTTGIPPAQGADAVIKDNKKTLSRRNIRIGLSFIAPALIVLSVFVFYPTIKTFFTSLTTDRINRKGIFVGLHNYAELFTNADFWTDFRNTVIYAVAYAPLVVIVPWPSPCCSTARTSRGSASSAPACSCPTSFR